MKLKSCSIAVLAFAIGGCTTSLAEPSMAGDQSPALSQPNIIFVLNDDQRYDAMGFIDPTLETPNMDRIAAGGVHLKNAFVTTSLCSPSRASIITGNYMHDHGIVDNNTKFEDGAVFFPSHLQKAGYQTAFIGKWHMGGHTDAPQPGFDHWVSFVGQGNYLPTKSDGSPNMLNVNGTRVAQRGYMTDDLTNYALEWLGERDNGTPFFLYLSHKAVHADFIPAERHKTQYSDVEMVAPPSMADTPENYDGKPLWVKNQRNSWHGVDFPYHSELDVLEYRRRYNQTLSAVDDGLGEIMASLEEKGMLDNTIIMVMGDNGFMFGEHGLIDKRNAYEESMRVPLIATGPGIAAGKTVTDVVAGIDIGPTLLQLGDAPALADVDGASFAAQLQDGENEDGWRDALLYEYFWEYNYPHTPTTFAVRTDRYKLIQYHGLWDTEELYDLHDDPSEMNNLIDAPELENVRVDLRAKLYDMMMEGREGKPTISFSERFGPGAVFRAHSGSMTGEYPQRWLRNPGDEDVRRHTQNEGGKNKRGGHE